MVESRGSGNIWWLKEKDKSFWGKRIIRNFGLIRTIEAGLLGLVSGYVIQNSAQTAQILWEFHHQPRIAGIADLTSSYDYIAVISADTEVNCKGERIPNAVGRNRLAAGIEIVREMNASKGRVNPERGTPKLLLLDGPADSPAMLTLTQETGLIPPESIEVSLDSPTTDQSILQEKDFFKGRGKLRVLNISSRDHLDRVVLLEKAHRLQNPQLTIDHMAAEDIVPLDNSAANIPNSIGSVKLHGKSLHEWGGITLLTLDRDSRMLRTIYDKVPGIKNWWRYVQSKFIYGRKAPASLGSQSHSVNNSVPVLC